MGSDNSDTVFVGSDPTRSMPVRQRFAFGVVLCRPRPLRFQKVTEGSPEGPWSSRACVRVTDCERHSATFLVSFRRDETHEWPRFAR